MYSNLIPRKILYYTIGGKRPVGKPKRRRTEKVEEDSRKILGTINWKRKAMDRQGWEGYIHEAKARHRAEEGGGGGGGGGGGRAGGGGGGGEVGGGGEEEEEEEEIAITMIMMIIIIQFLLTCFIKSRVDNNRNNSKLNNKN
jgi:hypothetical protein